MHLYSNNIELPFSYIEYVFDIFDHSPKIVVNCYGVPMNDSYILKNKVYTQEGIRETISELAVDSLTHDKDASAVPILVPKKFEECCKTLYGTYVGNSNPKQVAQRFGLNMNSNSVWTNSNWIIPTTSIYKFLDCLNDFGNISNGHGYRITFNDSGTLTCYDFKALFENKEIPIQGEIQSSIGSDHFKFQTQGSYTINYMSANGIIPNKLLIQEGYGQGSVDYFQTNDSSEGMLDMKLTNMFYRQLFTSWNLVVKLTTPIPPIVGSLVALPQFSKKFLVRGIRMKQVPEHPAETTLTLCRPLL